MATISGRASFKHARLIIALATIAALAAPASQAAGSRRGNAAFPDTIQRNLPAGTIRARTTWTGTGITHTKSPHLISPSDHIANAFTGPGAETNPRNAIAAARSFLEATSGARIPNFLERLNQRRETGTSMQSSSAQSPSSVSTDRIGIPGGDLTGDGLDDALTIEFAFDNQTYDLLSITMHGVRGKDGQDLWSSPLPMDVWDGFLIPASDLTGDGGADVILLELFIDEFASWPCLPCEYKWHWVVEVVSGSDGSTAWSRTFPGGIEDTYVGAGAFVAGVAYEEFTLTNALVIPLQSADHNGDGAADLVIDAFSASGRDVWVGTPVSSSERPEIQVATAAEVVKGQSGETIFSRNASYQNGGAQLQPAGGSAGDLLWQALDVQDGSYTCTYILGESCTTNARAQLHLELLDGDDFSSVWQSQIGDDSLVVAEAQVARADLNGDGSPDFFLYEITNSDGTYTFRQGAVSGSNGSILWMTDDESYFDVIGPAGGAPGDDLLSTSFDWDIEGITGVALTRIDGATGAPIFTTHYTVPPVENGFADAFVFVAGDTDGDHVSDIGIETYRYSFDTGLASSTALIESGADGSAIYSVSGDGSEFLAPFGDLNADGTVDLIGFRFTFYEDSVTMEMSPVLLPAGTRTWTRTDVFSYNTFWLSIFSTRDQSGRGGDDLLMTQMQEVGVGDESRIEGIEGSTGKTRWGYGDDLTPPPPPPPTVTGSISGLVVNASTTPVEGMCVEAIDAEGGWGSALSGSDGRYSLQHLRDGTYSVHFIDCEDYTYKEQWYNGKTDMASADRVIVKHGRDTGDINAVLEAALPIRTETKPYIAVIGDELVTGPLPGGLTNDCRGSDQSLGGTCFQLDGTEKYASFTITDADATAVIGGEWAFTDDALPLPNTFSYGTFCGSSSRVKVPEGAVEVYVFTFTARSALQCDEGSAPTTGTVTATFY